MKGRKVIVAHGEESSLFWKNRIIAKSIKNAVYLEGEVIHIERYRDVIEYELSIGWQENKILTCPTNVELPLGMRFVVKYISWFGPNRLTLRDLKKKTEYRISNIKKSKVPYTILMRKKAPDLGLLSVKASGIFFRLVGRKKTMIILKGVKKPHPNKNRRPLLAQFYYKPLGSFQWRPRRREMYNRNKDLKRFYCHKKKLRRFVYFLVYEVAKLYREKNIYKKNYRTDYEAKYRKLLTLYMLKLVPMLLKARRYAPRQDQFLYNVIIALFVPRAARSQKPYSSVLNIKKGSIKKPRDDFVVFTRREREKKICYRSLPLNKIFSFVLLNLEDKKIKKIRNKVKGIDRLASTRVFTIRGGFRPHYDSPFTPPMDFIGYFKKRLEVLNKRFDSYFAVKRKLQAKQTYFGFYRRQETQKKIEKRYKEIKRAKRILLRIREKGTENLDIFLNRLKGKRKRKRVVTRGAKKARFRRGRR